MCRVQAVVADTAALTVAVPQGARTTHQVVEAILIRVAPTALVAIAAVPLDTGHVGVFLPHAVRRRHAGITDPAAAGTSRTTLHARGAVIEIAAAGMSLIASLTGTVRTTNQASVGIPLAVIGVVWIFWIRRLDLLQVAVLGAVAGITLSTILAKAVGTAAILALIVVVAGIADLTPLAFAIGSADQRCVARIL